MPAVKQTFLELTKHPPQTSGICDWYVNKWFKYFINDLPRTVALLKVEPHVDYFNVVNAKTRNMIRKAVKLGYYRVPFQYNLYRDEMFIINTSADSRQDRPMHSSYFTELAEIAEPEPPICVRHVQIYYGVFDRDGHLVAYCWLALCENVAIINRILGHADFQKDGIMNLLFYGLYNFCKEKKIDYINYRTMESATKGLESFKKHVGFKPVLVEVVR